MEGLLILLGLGVPIGLVVGWVLGILGWREATRARREIAELRALLQAITARAAEAPPAASPVVASPVVAPPATAAPARMAAPNPWTVPPPAAAPPAPPPVTAPAGPGLEAVLTLRWGTWLGAAALLLAGVFLLRFAIEEGWLGPAARCALAGLLGVAMILGAEWLRRRPSPDRPGIPWPDQAPAALAAGGAATLFGAAYATAVMYALVPPLVGFALLALAALAAMALALRHGPLVAAVGIAGAYCTPALVETQDPSLPGLYAYLLVVTAAALVVVRQVAAAWLGWAATLAAAGWVVAGGVIAATPAELWWPALFVPAAAALHLALLPGAALDSPVGRRLAWVPFAVLATAGLVLLAGARTSLAPAAAILLLTPVAVLAGARDARLDRMPWLAALAGLLLLLAWPIGAWVGPGERVTVEGAVLAILPGAAWPPEAVQPFLLAALLLAVMGAGAGSWLERRAPRPLHWAALPAAVPLLVLLVAYARVRGFALDLGWGFGALALAAALVGTATLAARAGAPARAGVHAAGATGALALAAAMVLTEQWLTLAVALFLPPLALIAVRAGLPALRQVALAVAAVVLARLLLNPAVLGYGFGDLPVLNGLWLAYGVPAASFAVAAVLFRRGGDDATVAVLEAGAIALATALLLLLVRHGLHDATLGRAGWSFREAAVDATGLLGFGTLLLLANWRLGGRPAILWGWRVLLGAGVVLGAGLILRNPVTDPRAALIALPIANELLLAYAIPAILAARAARAPETAAIPPARQVLAGYAVAAAFAWVTLEVRHLFQPDAKGFAFDAPGEAELYAYSGAWLLLAGGLLALGIRSRIPALRLAALAVIVLTIAKAFLVDMGGLVGLWRVLSFLGLGLALIGLGWVYRRFVVPTAAAVPR